ncbi:DUF485 domain-containing protein [Streptomyces vastus]|uniref:DUF485 domain-containing protein n=1 Tax=Streptomyces vastus TaxID=285451 RepID=A0ABP6DS46_9ACTN
MPPAPSAENRVASHPDFRSIRGSHRSFGIAAILISVGGFLLFVLLSNFATGVLNQKLFGHVTVGLVGGIGQFVVMAVTAWRYTVHMERRIDPAVDRLRAEIARDEAEQARLQQARVPQERRFGSW